MKTIDVLMQNSITLSDVAKNPQQFTYEFRFRDNELMVLRPLLFNDVEQLAKFFEGLSTTTRKLSTFASYDRKMAQEFCDAINKYDKLRFVVESKSKIIGLLEFSFGIPDSDLERYKNYSVLLIQDTDCRFGPTLADIYQNKGLGSVLIPYIKSIAQKFGKQRIILFGGVLNENMRAIHFYKKHGFQKVGEFVNDMGIACTDMLLEM